MSKDMRGKPNEQLFPRQMANQLLHQNNTHTTEKKNIPSAFSGSITRN